MSILLRDAAALVVLASFAVTVSLWSEIVARLV